MQHANGQLEKTVQQNPQQILMAQQLHTQQLEL
jgi:hypothetical protein